MNELGAGFSHQPVMPREVLEIFAPVPGGSIVDATVGGGGHARLLLESRPDLHLLGLDRDPHAVVAARQALARFAGRAHVVHRGFEVLDEVVEERTHGTPEPRAISATDEASRVVGVLFDLGVSSPQLDRPERGFSYRFDAPLDMRMDPTRGRTAADVVNESSERELAEILRRYGEEPFARAIARLVVRRRPLRTTGELVAVIEAAVPARARRRRGKHPARRTFQALRIVVNDELGRLDAGLDAAVRVLVPGGRVAVISYHSLEDRMVKQRFADWSTGGLHPPGMPTLASARAPVVRLLTRRPLRPAADEVAVNPRAESARLRAVEKLHPAGTGSGDDAA